MLGHPAPNRDVNTRDASPQPSQLISARNRCKASSSELRAPAAANLAPSLLRIDCYTAQSANHLACTFQIHDNANENAGGVVDGKGAAMLADAIHAGTRWRGLRDCSAACRVTRAHGALLHGWGCGPRPRRVPARAGYCIFGDLPLADLLR